MKHLSYHTLLPSRKINRKYHKCTVRKPQKQRENRKETLQVDHGVPSSIGKHENVNIVLSVLQECICFTSFNISLT